MELKVACDCGQKYKFDVEPVEGRMPFAVNCPVCGVDGTPAANQLLTQQLFPAAPAPAAIANLAPAAAGALRINRPTATATAPPPLFASPTAPSALPGTKPITAMKPMMKAPIDAPKEFKMGLGILGAFLGSAVGGALVYAFFLWAQFRFPLTGTIVGVLSGVGARTLARGTDTVLGAVAGAFALVSVGGAFFLMYGGLSISAIVSMVICVSFAYRIASG